MAKVKETASTKAAKKAAPVKRKAATKKDSASESNEDFKEAVLKKTDYTVELGIEKRQYRRGVTTYSGSPTNITVTLILNHKKGLIKVEGKLDNDQISGNSSHDQAMRQSLAGLQRAATSIGVAWRNDWKKNNASDDQDPIPGLE